MDKQPHDLWEGGAWEQPSRPVCSPISIPNGRTPYDARRPILYPRKGPRTKYVFVFGCSLFLLLSIAIVITFSRGFHLTEFTPSDGGNATALEEPPAISRAPTGSGVTVTLLPPAETAQSNTEIYDKIVPSIVSIFSSGVSGSGSGTGIVLTQDGYLLTNAHVVANANHVEVALHNNQVLEAKLVGFHAKEDLAVLKVDTQGLTPAQFGDSDALRCGDPVVALGDPLGYRSTITEGIVSALDREVHLENSTMILIQTSAAINFGNSGGALVNQYGQVVGITTIKIVTNDGSAEALGFAIPSSRVKYVVDRLIAGTEVCAGSFGFTVGTFPVDGGGLEVYSVDTRSDSFFKGIQVGDVLVSANGITITGTQDLVHLKLTLGAGDCVSLTLLRNGEPYTVEVVLVDSTIFVD